MTVRQAGYGCSSCEKQCCASRFAQGIHKAATAGSANLACVTSEQAASRGGTVANQFMQTIKQTVLAMTAAESLQAIA